MGHAILLQALTLVLRPMTSYRALELGMPVFWLGALSACFAVIPLVVAIPTGRVTDRLGEVPIMLAGAVLLVASAVVFLAFSDSIAGLVLGSLVLGTGQLLSVVGEQAMVANIAGQGRYDAAFGQYAFAASVGQTAGPGIIVALGGGGTFPAAGAVFAGAAVISLILLATTALIRPPRAHAQIRDEARTAALGSALRIPGLVRAVLASAVILSAVDILIVYLPALGSERGIASGVVGALLAVRAGTSMLSRLFLARLALWLGRRRLFVASAVVSALAVGAMAVPQPAVTLAIAVAVAGFALGLGQPLTMSWLAETAPRGLRGTAMALRLTGNRLGQMVVPTATGLVAAGAGTAGVLAMTAAVLIGAGLSVRGADVDSPTMVEGVE
jgi:MFS family permease